ncbi:MAG: hypothetical protein F2840_18480 [Actinobacteria bacterium]|nr:hypothetical protein [Actinomycetota bacterium]
MLTDTIGMLLAVIVHPASVQDPDGAEPLLRQARRLFPFVERSRCNLLPFECNKLPFFVGATSR